MYNKIIVRIIFYKLTSNIYFKKNLFNYSNNMVSVIFIYNNTYKILTNMYIYILSQKENMNLTLLKGEYEVLLSCPCQRKNSQPIICPCHHGC